MNILLKTLGEALVVNHIVPEPVVVTATTVERDIECARYWRVEYLNSRSWTYWREHAGIRSSCCCYSRGNVAVTEVLHCQTMGYNNLLLHGDYFWMIVLLHLAYVLGHCKRFDAYRHLQLKGFIFILGRRMHPTGE